jgi:hypothetical protein
MLKPKICRYRVVEGDCLWKIAEAQYGNPTVWPEIAEINKLPDPDLILIGMTLQLKPVHDRRYRPHPARTGLGISGAAKSPQVTGANPSPPVSRMDQPHSLDLGPAPKGTTPSAGTAPITKPSVSSGQPAPKTVRGTGTNRARAVSFPAVRYKLDDLQSITISTPQVDFILRLIGELSVQQKGTMSEVELSQRGTLTGKLRADYNSKIANLIGQVKVGFNAQTRAAQVSCNLAVAAKMDGQVFATTQYEFIPPNRAKYSYKPRPIQGEWNDLVFSGNVGFELEVIFKRPDYPPPAEPVTSPARERSTSLAWVIAGALVVAGACIIVADLIKDVGTLGIGTVESPLSFAAAAALFAQAAEVAP